MENLSNKIITGEPSVKDNDKSYYIWYKDSNSSEFETQTLSYEYELMYQATKEAEYKQSLKIYVVTFVTIFALILGLLLFSPVIYKYFFSPEQKIEKIEENNTIEQNNFLIDIK
jgi:hypothetical protein